MDISVDLNDVMLQLGKLQLELIVKAGRIRELEAKLAALDGVEEPAKEKVNAAQR